MKKTSFLASLTLIIASFSGCNPNGDEELTLLLLLENQNKGLEISSQSSDMTQEQYRGLAAHWAPRFYQDTDDSYYTGDYFTRFNFDGDYNGKNNWENLGNVSTVPAYIYYAVSETSTHYFLNYSVFHPRDWHEWLTADEHENDLEAVTLVVKKTSGFGALIALETMAHNNFYQYAYAGGIQSGSDNIDGSVSLFGGSHPRIFIEAKGHGIYNCDSRCDSAPGGDGVVFYESDTAESPQSGGGNWSAGYGYKLIAMDADGSLDGNQGFWFRRNNICDSCTFGSWGKIRGDNHGSNKANLPWAYDDGDDGHSFAGDMICDPAKFFDIHLDGSPFDSGFSHNYVNHIYRTHSLEILQARSDKNRDPWGGKSDIYVRVTAPNPPAGSDQVVNTKAWKRNSASTGTWYDFSYGGANAEGENFGDTVRTHSFCRQGTPGIKFSVYDSDSNADDHMGTKTLTNSADYSGGIDLGDGRIKFRFWRY